MTVIKNMEFERIKYELFTSLDLKINIVVLPNYKNKNEGLGRGINSRPYKSGKYQDRNELEELKITTGDYISIDYFKYMDPNNSVSESIMFSYNKLDTFVRFLKQAAAYLRENYKSIYNTEKGIVDPSINQPFQSGVLSTLNGNKSVAMLPIMINSRVHEGYVEPGVAFYIGGPNCVSELSLSGFLDLCEVISEQFGTPDKMKLRCEAALNIAMQKQIMENQILIARALGANTFTGQAPMNNSNRPFGNVATSNVNTGGFAPRNNSFSNNNNNNGFPTPSNNGLSRMSIGKAMPKPTTSPNNTFPTTNSNPVTESNKVEVEKTNLDDLDLSPQPNINTNSTIQQPTNEINNQPTNNGASSLLDDIVTQVNKNEFSLEDDLDI